jgi:hypothetical protein
MSLGDKRHFGAVIPDEGKAPGRRTATGHQVHVLLTSQWERDLLIVEWGIAGESEMADELWGTSHCYITSHEVDKTQFID